MGTRTDTATAARIARHLRLLAAEIGPRPPGSPANRRATDYVADVLAAAGLEVATQPFACRWWEPGPGELVVGEERVAVAPNPFSAACDVSGPVVRRRLLETLRREPPAPGSVVVLDGPVSAEPVLPKAFPFAAVDEHRRLVDALERSRPAAVLAVSPRGRPVLPFFEDPDLSFPSATLDAKVGARLRSGEPVGVRLGGQLRAGEGVNVSACTPGAGPRVVLAAHVDSKVTTPGALDNAGGVAALLALAEEGLDGLGPLEVVLFNGEDHYAAPGEVAYLAATDLSLVRMMVNLDGAGARGRGTEVAALAFPEDLERHLAGSVGRRPGWSTGAPWWESDHAVFAMRGIPSVAVTSAGARDLIGTLVHTPGDTVDVVDTAILADVVAWLRDLLASPAVSAALASAGARRA